MEKRIEELASMRAPNTSGVDTKAVIQALAGNPQVVATPTTYAFGMNVEDAQREGQLGAQAQRQREVSIQDARNAAIQQDQQAFDIAMKAHNQYMAERNLAVQERVAAAEIAMKQARMAGIPAEIETRKLANEKLRGEIEFEKQLDALKIPIRNPSNPEQVFEVPARVAMTTGGKNLMSYLSGNNPNETATERAIKQRAKVYTDKGLSPEGAYLMSSTNLANNFNLLNKAVDADIKNAKSKYRQLNYGTKGTDKNGKPIPKTLEDYRKDIWLSKFDSFFPQLSEADRTLIKNNWGPGAQGFLGPAQEEPFKSDIGTLSEQDMDALTRAIMEGYR